MTTQNFEAMWYPIQKYPIALAFYRRLGSTDAKSPVKRQS